MTIIGSVVLVVMLMVGIFTGWSIVAELLTNGGDTGMFAALATIALFVAVAAWVAKRAYEKNFVDGASPDDGD